MTGGLAGVDEMEGKGFSRLQWLGTVPINFFKDTLQLSLFHVSTVPL